MTNKKKNNEPKKKIETATPEQWARIEEIRKQWIAAQADPIDLADVRVIVDAVWKRLGYGPPKIHVVESPKAAVIEAAKVLGKKPKEVVGHGYWSVWWRAWTGWYAGAQVLGVEFDKDDLWMATEWARCVPFVMAYDEMAVVSKNPIKVGWDEDNRIHCNDGPAVLYSDGWGLWAIHGVRVPQHVVETPEKITIDEIRKCGNAEVARVMRERYGEGRYLQDCGAEVVDSDVGGSIYDPAPRMLLRDGKDMWLVGTDGGTGRTYYMPADPDVKTCKEAHERMCGFSEDKIQFGS